VQDLREVFERSEYEHPDSHVEIPLHLLERDHARSRMAIKVSDFGRTGRATRRSARAPPSGSLLSSEEGQLVDPSTPD